MKPSIVQLVANFKEEGIAAFTDMSDTDKKSLWNWSRDVICRYSNATKDNPASVRDSHELPYPKEEIKIAAKVSLIPSLARGSEEATSNIIGLFLELASFQEVDPKEKMLLSRGDYDDTDRIDDLKREIEPIYHKYMEAVASERKSLDAEINAYLRDIARLGKD